MKRVPRVVRSRAGRISIAVAVVAAALVGMAAPAYAHHSVLSGSTECSDGQHVVTWTIRNISGVNLPMSVDSASATNGGHTYSVTGYANPVPDSATTSATSVLPGGSTGDVVLHVEASWSDGYNWSGDTSVPLEHNCMSSSTTTTEASTTTTAPTTTTTEAAPTTTVPQETTTSIEIEGSTTVPPFTVPPPVTATTVPDTPISGQATTSTAPPGAVTGNLPFTGGDMGFPIVFGLSLLGAGALLVARKRRAWSR